MNVPNTITVFRIILIPFFIWQFLAGNDYIAAGIYLLAWFSDVLDGYIARRFNLVTDFGKLFDPLADKLMNLTALFLLAYKATISWWLPIIVLAKELTLSIGGMVLLKYRNKVVAAKWPGKIATFLFTVAVILMLFPATAGFAQILAWIALAVAFVALADYTISFFKVVKADENKVE